MISVCDWGDIDVWWMMMICVTRITWTICFDKVKIDNLDWTLKYCPLWYFSRPILLNFSPFEPPALVKMTVKHRRSEKHASGSLDHSSRKNQSAPNFPRLNKLAKFKRCDKSKSFLGRLLLSRIRSPWEPQLLGRTHPCRSRCHTSQPTYIPVSSRERVIQILLKPPSH